MGKRNAYHFRVPTDAGKVEIRQAVEKVFGVKVAAVNTSTVKGKARRRGYVAGKRRLEEGDGRPSVRSDPGPLLVPAQQAQGAPPWVSASTSRPPRAPSRHRAGLLEITSTSPEKSLLRSAQEDRGPEQPWPHHRSPPWGREQAPLPRHRLEAQQGRRPRPRRDHRVRPQPHLLHRPPALPGRGEGLHPRAPRPRGRADRDQRHRLRAAARQRDDAQGHPGRRHGAQHRASCRVGGQPLPLRRLRRPPPGQGGRLRRHPHALGRACAASTSPAAPRWVASATRTTRT